MFCCCYFAVVVVVVVVVVVAFGWGLSFLARSTIQIRPSLYFKCFVFDGGGVGVGVGWRLDSYAVTGQILITLNFAVTTSDLDEM